MSFEFDVLSELDMLAEGSSNFWLFYFEYEI